MRDKEINRYELRECVCLGGGIMRKIRRDGLRYGYKWRGQRGKNIYLTRCIDLSVDVDL